MNGQVYTITQAQFAELLPVLADTDRATMLSAGRVSELLLAGMYRDGPVCFLGFVPTTLVSDSVYMWMWVTPTGAHHPLLVARHSRAVVQVALTQWPRIIGNCTTRRAVQWLSWLGADFNGSGQFELRRAE